MKVHLSDHVFGVHPPGLLLGQKLSRIRRRHIYKPSLRRVGQANISLWVDEGLDIPTIFVEPVRERSACILQKRSAQIAQILLYEGSDVENISKY